MALPSELRLSDPAVLIATFFGTGALPKMPGTWGSLATLPLGVLLLVLGGPWAVAVGAAVAFLIGWWATARVLEQVDSGDPGYIVIDEVAGQLMVLAMVPPDVVHVAFAFAIFRAFDILKPWPIGWLDRNIHGALGVMVDDIAAGALGALVVGLGGLIIVSYVL
ncbi:MAG: phosphatidylglycerophosphatase A [Alphaproteobacteria bacterium]|jgi:phosphatidylglycerophosphatase A